MAGTFNDVLVDVTLECYRRVARLQPGSEEAEVAEHAIDLALSPRRRCTDRDRLLLDVDRNARHAVRRGRVRERRMVADAGVLADRGQPTGASCGFRDLDDPAVLTLAAELDRTVRGAAAAFGDTGERVLDGLLQSETVAATARSARVSASTVDRVRRSIRTQALAAGYGPA